MSCQLLLLKNTVITSSSLIFFSPTSWIQPKSSNSYFIFKAKFSSSFLLFLCRQPSPFFSFKKPSESAAVPSKVSHWRRSRRTRDRKKWHEKREFLSAPVSIRSPISLLLLFLKKCLEISSFLFQEKEMERANLDWKAEVDWKESTTLFLPPFFL